MKKVITMLVLATIAFTGLTACSLWDKKIKGSGVVTTETRSTSPFKSVKVQRGVTVVIAPGADNGITVHADDNILPYITTSISGNTLQVSIQKDITIGHYKEMTVYVTMQEIEDLTVSSGAEIKSTQRLEIKEVNLSASSGSDIDLILGGDRVNVDVSSGADVVLSGAVNFLKVTVSSGSDFKGKNLTAKIGDVSVSSGADASLNVTDEISCSASSGGDIKYWGNPKVIISHTSSGGDVTHY